MTLSGKTTLLLTAVVIVGGSLLAVVNYTDACRLKNVSYNSNSVDNWQDRFGLDEGRSVIKQPVDSLASVLLARKDVFKVNVDYSLGGSIDIRTNNFEPVCFLLDKSSGRLYGVNGQARLISLKNLQFAWEHPVLTSLDAGRLHQTCPDVRVAVVIEQLRQLRDSKIDLYRLVDEIDFGHKDYLQVTISGLPHRLKVRAEWLRKDLQRFIEFAGKFAPGLDSVETIDLRFDDMIICANRDR